MQALVGLEAQRRVSGQTKREQKPVSIMRKIRQQVALTRSFARGAPADRLSSDARPRPAMEYCNS